MFKCECVWQCQGCAQPIVTFHKRKWCSDCKVKRDRKMERIAQNYHRKLKRRRQRHVSNVLSTSAKGPQYDGYG